MKDNYRVDNPTNRQPFGDPDGARADLEKSANIFIAMDDRQFPSGIATSDHERTIRVIVGKKGAGKTIYLRRLQDSARREESVFSSKIAKDIPSTNSVIEFCQTFDEDKVTEAWQSAWRIAILLSAVSHVCIKQFFSPYFDQAAVTARIQQLIPGWKKPSIERSPYSELKDLIARFRSPKVYWEHVNASYWDDLQSLLGTELKNCPPIFLYLDASDDEFTHAPMEWHRCQKGLFYAVMRLLSQSGAIGSRLHTVIAIRDIVYSSVLKSEHQTRYVNSPSISLLDWSRKSIEYFLEQKVQSLPSEYFENSFDKSVYNFLGVRTVRNETRDIQEDAVTYLLRHTRLLPRDIVQIGNAIAAEKLEYQRSDDRSESWDDVIRRTISHLAGIFGEEQIQICANQLSSHEAPSRSAQHRYVEYYTSNKDYVKTRSEIFKDFIREIGSERFSRESLVKAEETFSSKLPPDVRLSTILWQNGLIGVRRRESSQMFEFYSLGRSAAFSIPDNCVEYCFRSVVLDVVGGIKVLQGPALQEL